MEFEAKVRVRCVFEAKVQHVERFPIRRATLAVAVSVAFIVTYMEHAV